MRYDTEEMAFINEVLSNTVIYIRGEPSRVVYNCGLMPYMLIVGLGKNEGKDNLVSYSFHIQTKWRIINKSRRIVVADDDLFETDYYHKMSFVKKINKWQQENLPIQVKSFLLHKTRDLYIEFSNGDQLQVFNDTSEEYEIWRIISLTGKNLVVYGNGKTEFY